MTREEVALELTKTLLSQSEWSYNSTGEVLYDAVELTDMLLGLLAREPGSVKFANYEDEVEAMEASSTSKSKFF